MVVPEADPRARSLRLLVAALVALLLVGGGGLWLLRRSQAPAGSVAGVPAPGQGNLRGVGAPFPEGPGIAAGPGQGGRGLPSVAPGAGGPSVAGKPGEPAPSGPGVVQTPTGPAGPGVAQTPPGPGGPGVTGAPNAPQGGPPVTAAPQQPQGGPSVVHAPEQAKPGPGVTTTPPSATSGPAVTTTPASPRSGPPVTERPAAPRQPDSPPRMPDDIRRYLVFLERVERERRAYEARLSNILIRLIPTLMMPKFDEDSVQGLDPQVVGMYNRTAMEYATAGRRFHAAAVRIGVPPSCRVLHANYAYALNRHPLLINETARRLVNGDYGGLHQMLGAVGADVNEKFATADSELERICDQYNMRKPFTLGNARSGGSLFGF
jgi:hypothetical protein